MRRSAIVLPSSFCLFVLLTLGALPPLQAAPSAVLAGFRAQSVSFISPKLGWMLGVAPCGQLTCATVAHTTNGGATWSRIGTLDGPISFEKESGVTEVRFADDLHGWAFEPAFSATDDGGATWQREAPPGGGHLVLALAADAEAAYAVVSPCRLNRPCGAPATLWRTTPGEGSWRRVAVELPVFASFDTAVLSVHGLTAYLAVPAALIDGVGPDTLPDTLDVTTDGVQWTTRPDPCSPQDGETLTGIAAVSDTKVALLCQGNIGFGKAAKLVHRSSDTAQTTRSAGTLSEWGIVSQLAAAPDGTLVVSSYSIGSWIYRNAGGTTWTTSADLSDGGQGWNDIAMTTNHLGFVIHGPAACCGGSGPGELWTTTDGGVTWDPAA